MSTTLCRYPPDGVCSTVLLSTLATCTLTQHFIASDLHDTHSSCHVLWNFRRHTFHVILIAALQVTDPDSTLQDRKLQVICFGDYVWILVTIFEPHSSCHVGTVGKSFTRNFMYDVMRRPVAAFRLNSTPVNVLWCVRLYIKRKYYYYYFNIE